MEGPGGMGTMPEVTWGGDGGKKVGFSKKKVHKAGESGSNPGPGENFSLKLLKYNNNLSDKQ